jgi:hypothetical protein
VCILINIVVYEKVKDHAAWLKGFNADAPNRKGSMGGTLMQFDGDPNSHYIMFEFSDEGAQDFVKFAKSPSGTEGIQRCWRLRADDPTLLQNDQG